MYSRRKNLTIITKDEQGNPFPNADVYIATNVSPDQLPIFDGLPPLHLDISSQTRTGPDGTATLSLPTTSSGYFVSVSGPNHVSRSQYIELETDSEVEFIMRNLIRRENVLNWRVNNETMVSKETYEMAGNASVSMEFSREIPYYKEGMYGTDDTLYIMINASPTRYDVLELNARPKRLVIAQHDEPSNVHTLVHGEEINGYRVFLDTTVHGLKGIDLVAGE